MYLKVLSLLMLILFLAWQAIPLPAQTDNTHLIDDFESDNFADRWWSYSDSATGSLACTRENTGYASDHSLGLTFATETVGSPGCGTTVQTNDDWTAADGLSFFWRSGDAGVKIVLVLNVEDPTQINPDAGQFTPFEVSLVSTSEEWTPVDLPWDTFRKSTWVGESGTSSLNPAQIVEILLIPAEIQNGVVWIDDLRLTLNEGTMPVSAGYDKFALWQNDTQLRGVNIWQRLVVPSLDGPDFLGSEHVGPPFVQEDFDRVAALGANYINISGPGLFTERPPYVLDEAVQAHLDNLLAMIAQADMFAVISFRTGPGRSDFTFYSDGMEESGHGSLLNDEIWREQAAQDAWVEMWRYTAQRYQNNPIVVGYDLMVEPNSAGVWFDIWEPDEFYPAYANTLYDWNQFYPRLVAAVREVDPNTPILIAASGYSGVRWLPYLEPVDDSRMVYIVHQYEPSDYIYQEPPGEYTYPGTMDLNWDGVPDTLNRDWLADLFVTVDDFTTRYNVPVAANEFGVVRWAPGAAAFMNDQMDLFEERGVNYAFWALNPAWPPFAENDDFDFLHGPDPENHAHVDTSDLIQVILNHWNQNTIRPSNVGR